MIAYEVQTNINQRVINIPLDYLKQLDKSENVRVIILTEADNKNNLNKLSNSKLSEFLLLSELEDE